LHRTGQVHNLSEFNVLKKGRASRRHASEGRFLCSRFSVTKSSDKSAATMALTIAEDLYIFSSRSRSKDGSFVKGYEFQAQKKIGPLEKVNFLLFTRSVRHACGIQVS
jgi:hypothetical protein